MLLLTPVQNFSGECPPTTICVWDVNFDCAVDGDDLDAILEYIENCETEPCLCEGGGSFGGEGGLSVEDFAAALAAEPTLTEETIALAWEHFFAALN